MNTKNLLRAAVFAVFLFSAGCTLVFITADSAPVATPTIEPTAAPTLIPTPTSPPTPVPTVVVECTSLLNPGIWSGTVNLKSTVSGSGLRVIDQSAQLPLELDIACDGTVSGTAARQGQASIRYPLVLSGACVDQETYDVRGQVIEGPDGPGLELQFTTREGTLACDIDSRLPSIPEGEQRTDLTGRTFTQIIFANQLSDNRISGIQWSDRLYEEQFTELEAMITQFGLTSEKTAAWQLDRLQ